MGFSSLFPSAARGKLLLSQNHCSTFRHIQSKLKACGFGSVPPRTLVDPSRPTACGSILERPTHQETFGYSWLQDSKPICMPSQAATGFCNLVEERANDLRKVSAAKGRINTECDKECAKLSQNLRKEDWLHNECQTRLIVDCNLAP